MESNWAAENLQTIRTLMERSAIYRRALAPVSIYVGLVGIIAAIVGWQLLIEQMRSFGVYWMTVSIVAISGGFILVRRQALKDKEPFWSPPTRRVAQAMIPALTVGFAYGVTTAVFYDNSSDLPPAIFSVPPWTLLYGLALHAAGFFMPRGIRLFGWGFLLAGIIMLFGFHELDKVSGNLLMGIVFGGFHLAYGIYLYFTEPRKNEA